MAMARGRKASGAFTEGKAVQSRAMRPYSFGCTITDLKPYRSVLITGFTNCITIDLHRIPPTCRLKDEAGAELGENGHAAKRFVGNGAPRGLSHNNDLDLSNGPQGRAAPAVSVSIQDLMLIAQDPKHPGSDQAVQILGALQQQQQMQPMPLLLGANPMVADRPAPGMMLQQQPPPLQSTPARALANGGGRVAPHSQGSGDHVLMLAPASPIVVAVPPPPTSTLEETVESRLMFRWMLSLSNALEPVLEATHRSASLPLMPSPCSVVSRFQTMLVYSRASHVQLQAFYEVLLAKFLAKAHSGPEQQAKALAEVMLSAVYQSNFNDAAAGLLQ